MMIPLLALWCITVWRIGQPSPDELIKIGVKMIGTTSNMTTQCMGVLRVSIESNSLYRINLSDAVIFAEAYSGIGLAKNLIQHGGSKPIEKKIVPIPEMNIRPFSNRKIKSKEIISTDVPINFDSRNFSSLLVKIDIKIDPIPKVLPDGLTGNFQFPSTGCGNSKE